jgi:Glycosyltransferase family 9 (heptosyltransferase)
MRHVLLALGDDLSKALTDGRWRDALRLADSILRIDGDQLDVRRCQGECLFALGHDREAEQVLRQVLRSAPPNWKGRGGAEYVLGQSLLASGRYTPEAWRALDGRHAKQSAPVPTPASALTTPEWRGEDIRGRHLQIWPEQGLGDEIQFARFAPWLAASGVQVTLICRPPLCTLFRSMGVEICSLDDVIAKGAPAADVWAMIWGVPGRAGVTLENLPSAPYLKATKTRSVGGRVGLATRGSPTNPNDAHRSLPAELAAELLMRPGAVSLHPEDTGARDFAETAEIIAGLDLVISVDTSVAHLAGAMGKPVWILISAMEDGWRWMRGRTDSPWYPSATLYRQQTVGDWRSVIDRVNADLDGLGSP